MPDQFGDSTFFVKFGQGPAINVKPLVKNQWTVSYIDVKALSLDVLNKINPNLNPADYFISMILVGWEIWGSYQTNIEFRNLNLKAIPFPRDFNADGQINSQDIKILLSMYSTSDSTIDLSEDGRVNGIDFGEMVRY